MLIYFKFSYLLGAIAPFLVGIFVYLTNKNKTVNRMFFLLSLCGAVWSLGLFFMINTQNITIGYYCRLFMDCGSILLPAFWLHFIYSILDYNSSKRKELYIYYFIGIILLIFNFLDFFIPGSFVKEIISKGIFNFYPTAGIGYYLFVFYFLMIIPYSLLHLIRGYKNSRGFKKQQIKYIIIAGVLGFGGGGTSFFLTFNIPILPYGIILFALYPVMIAYAITRYQLMDIRVVIRQSSVILSTLLSIIIMFLTVIWICDYLVDLNINYTLITIISFIFIITVSLFIPIKNFFERISNKYFFASLYNEEQILQNLIKEIPSVLDAKQLIDLVVDTTKSVFQLEKVVLWSVDLKNKKFIPLKPTNCPTEYLTGFLGNKVLINNFLKTREPIIAQKIEYIVSNYSFKEKEMLSKMLEKMKKKKIEVVLPLVVKKELIGVLFLSNKIDGALYSSQDINILKTIANQSAAALENALLYKETKNFNITMKEEVKSATEKLRKANKKLRKLDKVKSEFISIASHQLRTPITIIKGYVSMLLEGDYGKINEKANNTLKQTYKSTEHMAKLVEDFLNISRIESGKIVFDFKKEKFDIIIKETVESFGEIVKIKKLKINLNIQNNLPAILVDKVKIKEVVSNLIDNAIKYTQQGFVSVSLKPIKEENKKFLLLSVADNGIGINKEDISNIFKKFIRGKKVSLVHTEGLGLGLYFSKKVVEAHHGKIWVESKGENKGSVFYVRLKI